MESIEGVLLWSFFISLRGLRWFTSGGGSSLALFSPSFHDLACAFCIMSAATNLQFWVETQRPLAFQNVVRKPLDEQSNAIHTSDFSNGHDIVLVSIEIYVWSSTVESTAAKKLCQT
jgi:hypothetical protein